MDVTIKFIKNCSPYVIGDIAGFDEQQAKKLEKAGIIKIEDGGKNATDNNSKGKKLSSGNSSK